MIKLLLVVTTMFASGADVRVAEVEDIDVCVAEAPAVLKGAEMVRGVRGAKVECTVRTKNEETRAWEEDIKVVVQSEGWVEPTSKSARFSTEQAPAEYGYGYGYAQPQQQPQTQQRFWDQNSWGYDRYGYDQYGFDRYGFDRYGYDRYGNRRPDLNRQWAEPNFCRTYPSHPACRYQAQPNWRGSPSRPIPNRAYTIPNPARPVTQ